MSLASSFTHEVSRLPFAGKHAIRPVAESALRERYVGPKIAKTLGGLAFMGLMVAAHAIQAKLGYSEFMRSASWYEFGDESLLRRTQAAYAAAYCAANVSVAAAQTYIGYRMGKSLIRTLRKPALVKPFEVGIDTNDSTAEIHPPFTVGIDTVTTESSNTYPAYEVGIDDERPVPATRQSFGEWRRSHAKPLGVAIDTAATLACQAAMLTSTMH